MTKAIYCTLVATAVLSLSIGSQAVELSNKERLGKIMYQDKDFSYNSTQSCQTCHHHTAGFADPTNARDPYVTVVSTGADGVSLGGRNAPSSAYAGFSPTLYLDTAGNFYGGMFWDGRATGRVLGDPLAEQAQGPPLNPVEMNMADKEAVVQAVRDADYALLFRKVFGPKSLDEVETAFDYISEAIAEYERSVEVQKFTSRYDTQELTEIELRGQALFDTNCTVCHSRPSKDTATNAASTDTTQDLFTTYGYANIGLPANPLVPVEADHGLGYTVDDLKEDYPEEFSDLNSADYDGMFKIPTLRNVAVTAPYGHNGYFATLKEMVEFLNGSQDTLEERYVPETSSNVTDKVGKMGMTDQDIDDIVQFLTTLTDK